MNYTGVSNWRSNTAEIFESLRFRARLENLSAKFLGKNTKLKGFAEHVSQPASTRIYLGEQEIPVDRINGSVGRENDFDSSFRPLKKHLRDRWIDIYCLFEADQLPPIQLFKTGNDYYVEDGHHRVSVARTIGRLSLRAQVWEIPLPPQKTDCTLCLSTSKERSRAMAHA